MITFNLKAIEKSLSSFSHYPFNYSVIDNFFTTRVAHDLGNSFPKYNRAIIFDTSQNSWHGLSREINLPKNIYRKSIAVYYLSKFKKNHLLNEKALFAPRENQKKSKDVLDLIKIRAHKKLFKKAYRK